MIFDKLPVCEVPLGVYYHYSTLDDSRMGVFTSFELVGGLWRLCWDFPFAAEWGAHQMEFTSRDEEIVLDKIDFFVIEEMPNYADLVRT